MNELVKNLDKGKFEPGTTTVRKGVPHVILPIKGRFKGEKGERCHLLPLSNRSNSGIPIRPILELLVKVRQEMKLKEKNPWAFVNETGQKMGFGEMNEIILERLELLQEDDDILNTLNLKEIDVRESYSINRSFRRGSATHAQNQKIPEPVINAQNRWRKIEHAKGKRPHLSMIENYSEIEQLIPTLVRYSELL